MSFDHPLTACLSGNGLQSGKEEDVDRNEGGAYSKILLNVSAPSKSKVHLEMAITISISVVCCNFCSTSFLIWSIS